MELVTRRYCHPAELAVFQKSTSFMTASVCVFYLSVYIYLFTCLSIFNLHIVSQFIYLFTFNAPSTRILIFEGVGIPWKKKKKKKILMFFNFFCSFSLSRKSSSSQNIFYFLSKLITTVLLLLTPEACAKQYTTRENILVCICHTQASLQRSHFREAVV